VGSPLPDKFLYGHALFSFGIDKAGQLLFDIENTLLVLYGQLSGSKTPFLGTEGIVHGMNNIQFGPIFMGKRNPGLDGNPACLDHFWQRQEYVYSRS
jgi:hypothetical protein